MMTGRPPGGSPNPGENWQHKGTDHIVTITYCTASVPVQVQWINRWGREGRDTLDSFLWRFEKAPE